MHDCRLLSFDIQPNSLVKYQKWHRAVALSTVFCVPFYAALRKYRKFIRKPLIKSDREMLLGKPPSISQNNFVSASIVQPHYIKHHFTRKKQKLTKCHIKHRWPSKDCTNIWLHNEMHSMRKKTPKCLRVAQMSKKKHFFLVHRGAKSSNYARQVLYPRLRCVNHQTEYLKIFLTARNMRRWCCRFFFFIGWWCGTANAKERAESRWPRHRQETSMSARRANRCDFLPSLEHVVKNEKNPLATDRVEQ